MKVLIIEDEGELRGLIARALRKEQFIVEEAADCFTAADKLAMFSYDCILLDIMLPDGNGLDLLRKLKDSGKGTNVIIISARNSVEDKVSGLEEGADDYLPKPFHMAELIARVKSVIRRSIGTASSGITCGNVKLYPEKRSVQVGGKELELVKKEYDILQFFLLRVGNTIDKETLAEAVWGDSIYLADSFDFIYSQMKNLRRKLQNSGADIEIRSIYGFGYRLVEKEEG